MNLRWGITPNLTMNGTVNPDFSQVESDAGQFSFDPRQALFFPEKRPFFLDGIEQFSTPNNLIYTRRVAAPIAAAKITGKVDRPHQPGLPVGGGRRVAVRERQRSPGVQHPARAAGRRRAVARRAGLYRSHRRQSIESRDRLRRALRVERHLQPDAAGRAQPDAPPANQVTSAPLWQGVFARAGRRFAVRYTVRGVDPDFRAAAGFISRTGVASGNFNHQVITYGKPGSALERWSSDVVLDGTWQYDELMAGRASQDRKLHFNNNFTFRGGWRAGGSVLIETFGYDQPLYADYFLGRQGASGLEFIPYPDGPRLPNLDYMLSAMTPQRAGVEIDAFVLWGKDENFYEWSSADIVFLNVGAAWKPTDKLRVDARYQLQSFRRRTDDSIVGIRRIPRVKAEYQISRPIFVRVVGEYNSDWQDDLRDDSRTNLPIYILNRATGALRSRCRSRTSEVVPRRLAVLVSADAGHGVVRRLRQHAREPRGGSADGAPAPHRRRILPEGELPVPALTARHGRADVPKLPIAACSESNVSKIVTSLGDGQQIRDLRRQVHQLDGAARLPLHDQVASHQLAQAAAVHVRHAGEVEQDLPLALKDDAGDGVAQQLGAVVHGQFPLQVEDGDVANAAFGDIHGRLPEWARKRRAG